MATDVEILFGGNASALNATIDEAKDKIGEIGEHAHHAGEESEGAFSGFIEKLEGMKEGVESVMSALGGFQDLIVEAFAVEQIEEAIHKVEEFAEHMADLGLQTSRAMEVLGVSAGDVAVLGTAAKLSGTSIESLEMMFSRLSRSLVNGSKSAKEAMAFFGLSVDEFLAASPADQFSMLAEAISRIPAGAERSANGMMLLGRNWATMAEFMARGSEGLKEAGEIAESTGLKAALSSEEFRGASERSHTALTTLADATEALGIAVYDRFSDVLNGAIIMLGHWAEAITEAINSNGLLRTAVDLLVGALKILELAVASVVTGFEEFFNVLYLVLAAIDDVAKGLDDMAASALKPVAEILGDIYTGFSKLAGGDFSGAGASFKAALSVDLFKGMEDAGKRMTEHLKASWEEYAEAQHKAAERYRQEWNTIIGVHDQETAKIEKTSLATAKLREEWEKVMDSVKGSGGEIDKLNSQIEILKEALGQAATSGQDLGAGMKATGSAIDMIKGFEGFRSKAYWDTNAFRIGYGSDTMTDAAGKVSKVVESSTTTIEDANRDLARRVAEFQAEAAKQIGDGWDALSDRVKASITSVAYNYGHVPATVVAAARTANEQAIADSIRALDVNKSRRAAEAANITATGTSVVPPEKVEETKRTLDELIKKRDELLKGTPRDIAEAKNLDDQIKGHGDLLKAKQRLIDADKEMIAGETDLKKKREDEKKLEEDTLALKKAKADATEADAKRAEAGAKGDPKAEHEAAMTLANLKLQQAKELYGVDSAEYKNALKEKEDADRKFTAETNALTKEKIEEDRRAAHDSANEQIKALNDAYSHKHISDAQWLASTHAVREAEFAEDKKLNDQELALADLTTEQKLKIKNKEADELRKKNEQEADDARKAADATAKDYEKMSNSIVGSFTGAIKGMITGHETFRQAAQKAMESLADKFIDLVGKMVAKWLAGEMAKTASSTAGVAARQAAETAGSAAGMASQLGGILKSIFASAGQAFAGVFGFLAPVMGPAAAGPAAGAEATVISVGAGLASADIGMWRVPNDQLAMVHRSELIMPAAQADSFRAMLSGSSPVGGGGGMGVSIHPALNMNVHAMDGDSVKSFMRNNQRQIMQSVHASVRQGAHLGLKSLT